MARYFDSPGETEPDLVLAREAHLGLCVGGYVSNNHEIPQPARKWCCLRLAYG